MKNFKIKTKLLLACMAISVVSIIFGIISALIMAEMENFGVSVVFSVVLVALALLGALMLANRLSKGIATPIQACSQRLSLMAQGDLSSPVPEVYATDEVGELTQSTRKIIEDVSSMIRDIDKLLSEMSNGNFNIHSENASMYRGDFTSILKSMRTITFSLSDTLAQIRQSAEQVASGADQVSTGAQTLAQGTTEQASAVQELSATVTEISEKSKNNAKSSELAREHSLAAGGQVDVSANYMKNMIKAMERITGASQEISKIISTIENIAFKTNILALNAAVEAARAGSAGKGFAVVAEEVRNLAGQSDQAAKATKELIEQSIDSVRDGNEILKSVSDSLQKTVELAELAVNDIKMISKATEEESEAIAQVTEGIEQVSAVVQTNSATSEESAAASEELSSQAALMKEVLQHFKLRHADGVSPTQSEPPARRAAAAVEPAAEDQAAAAKFAFDKY